MHLSPVPHQLKPAKERKDSRIEFCLMPVLWFSSSPPVAPKSNKWHNRGSLMTRRRCRVICFSWFGRVRFTQDKKFTLLSCRGESRQCDANLCRFPDAAVIWRTIAAGLTLQRPQGADIYWLFPVAGPKTPLNYMLSFYKMAPSSLSSISVSVWSAEVKLDIWGSVPQVRAATCYVRRPTRSPL